VTTKERTPNLPGRMRHVVRSRISEHPALYLPFARRKYRGPSPAVVDRNTQMVIEGYPASANTFAVYAFQMVQRAPVRLAHHLHAPAQLITAAKQHLPTLVVIREPEDAIISQLILESHVTARWGLVSYIRFYSCLLRYRSSFVVGDFDEVTQDFGSVVARVNEKFGTAFDRFVTTPESVRECFELMEQRPVEGADKLLHMFESGLIGFGQLRTGLADIAARQTSDEAASESASAESDQRTRERLLREQRVPSAERDRRKAALRAELLSPELHELRARARATYEQFVGARASLGG
jgi:hypothetical protein